MSIMETNPIITSNQIATAEMKKELEKLAEDKKNPKLVESFNNFVLKKVGQVF